MKNKSKYLIYVLIGVVIIALIVISVKYFGNDSSESKKESKENTVIDNQEMDFLLDKMGQTKTNQEFFASMNR